MIEIKKDFFPEILNSQKINNAIEELLKGKEKVLRPKKTFEQLASGFKSLIATIGDMLIRLEENLHWHPKFQRILIKRLSDVFPKIQFIVSTHSILPLLGAPSKSVFIKVTKDYESGIIMERINIDLQNLSPNIILTSPLFDTPILSVENKN